jgi:hypothetical protein
MRRMDVVTVPVGNLSGMAIDPTVVDPASPVIARLAKLAIPWLET